MADDWSIIRKYKANLKKCGGMNSKKCESKLLTIYTKAEAERVHRAVKKQADKIGGYAGDGWWDMITSIIIDGGKGKFNQALKIWRKSPDAWDNLEKWAMKQQREKKIKIQENYLYPLHASYWVNSSERDREYYFPLFARYCKGKKMKDKKYQKAYEKWLADKEKKKTTKRKRKAPAKKKTTTRKRKTAPKKSKRILRGKRKSPSTSATSVKVGTKRRGGDGKMYVCKTYKRGNKRVKRWVRA